MASLLANPLLPLYLVLAVLAVSGVLLYVILSGEVTYLRRKVMSQQKEFNRQLSEAAQTIATAKQELETRTVRQEPSPIQPGATATNIQIHRRSMIMRRLRAGETPEQIAAALQMSVSEVRLIQKVQQIVLESY